MQSAKDHTALCYEYMTKESTICDIAVRERVFASCLHRPGPLSGSPKTRSKAQFLETASVKRRYFSRVV